MPEALGFGVIAFIHITLATHSPDNAKRFRALVNRVDDIQEAYSLTGDADYLLKAVLRDLKSLSDIVNNVLMPHQSVAHVRSSIVLDRLKQSSRLPLRRAGALKLFSEYCWRIYADVIPGFDDVAPRNDEEGVDAGLTACSDRTAFPVHSSNRRSRPAASGELAACTVTCCGYRLEHEGHGAGQLDRLQLRIAGVIEGFAVRVMRQHAIVQADAAGRKPRGFAS